MSFPIPPENTGPDSLNIVVERNEWIKIQHQLALAREELQHIVNHHGTCDDLRKYAQQTLAKLGEK